VSAPQIERMLDPHLEPQHATAAAA
jgi:hypothetical protein